MDELTKEDFVAALQTEGVLRPADRTLLTHLCHAGELGATAGQLAAGSGYQDYRGANAVLGHLSRRIAEHLGIDLPDRPGKNTKGWWQLIATGEMRNQGFTWSLREPFVEALLELDVIAREEGRDFPGTAGAKDLIEGAKRRVTVNRYERNSEARRRCIAKHGAVCQACGFDFGKAYGVLGEGFIHVHHRVPVSEIDEAYKIDPEKDLDPVCPNCHAMLHAKDEVLTVGELREIINENRGKGS